MNALHRILATTDLSAPARRAIERAAQLSRETTASLELLHVANLAPLERLRQLMISSATGLEQQVLDTARENLRKQAAALQERYGVTAGIHVTSGSLLAQLMALTDSMAPDLLVCGARGESLLRHHLLGATAQRLLNKARCPVLVVKQVPEASYRRVLVPVDFSGVALRSIQLAQTLAPQGHIQLMHAFEPPFESHLRYASVDEATIQHYRNIACEEAAQQLRALRDQAALSVQACDHTVVHGDPCVRILEEELKGNYDLIVMGRQGAGVLEEILLGSVTRHVLTESQCDVLVVM